MQPMLLCAQITGLSLVAVSTAMLSRPRGMIIMVEAAAWKIRQSCMFSALSSWWAA